MKMLRRILIALLVLVLLSVSGFVVWANNAALPTEQAFAALNDSDGVDVTIGEWLVFEPRTAATSGLIFYPGGRVDARAYAPYAQAIAEAGYLVVIPSMPLNLAVFDIEAARAIIDAYPQITTWAVGGHSLGGSMAAQFAAEHREVRGLLFFASYAAVDLSARDDLSVLTVYGSEDGLATVASIDSNRALLPADAEFVLIEGGNHAQFGWYGVQAGDLPAQIAHDEQQRLTVEAVVRWLSALASDPQP